ncbi:choice-of-anchor L domain-containing protein, partial [Flavobacterium sp.]|uniref:choice-of-anchor L domain-containing protein n=1 Tax=Flavobacterium sp. TaxID=239 RepID=UPI0037BEF629
MKKQLLLFILLIIPFCVNAQLFVNNTTISPTQLVQDVLLGDGITVSNITFNGNPALAATPNVKTGFFTTGVTPTNLGINRGVILATNNAQAALGPNNSPSANNTNGIVLSPGDADLDQLTTNTINNKTILEFDFVPTGDLLTFKFVFASEEYPEFVNSGFNDVFGFFLSGPGIAGPYSNGAINIAQITASTTASNVVSINNVNGGFAVGCPFVVPGNAPSNQQYYVNNCGGTSIQYDGFTTVLIASSPVECGLTYHIKLAIANVGDNGYDSAVFLEDFRVTPFDLGDNLVGSGTALCEGDERIYLTGFDVSVPHEWYFGPDLIVGETGPTLTVSEPGQYTVIAYPYGPACPVTDSAILEYYPPIPVAEPIDLVICEPDNIFDLTVNTPIVLNGLDPFAFELNYALTPEDFEFFNYIPNPTTYVSSGSGEIIYVGVVDIFSGVECISIQSFELIQLSCTLDPQPLDLVLCDEVTLNDDFEIFDLTQNNVNALNGLDPALYEVTYHNSQVDADTGDFPISPATSYNGTNETIYVRVVETAFPSNFGTESFTLTVNPLPEIASIFQEICSEGTFTVTPNGSGSNVIPTGTTYTWTVVAPAGITGASDEATAQTSISQTLTNTSNAPIDVVYTVTASVGTSPNICIDTFTITITVNPNPTVTVNSPSVCDGTSATVTATPGVAGSYDYAWSVPSGPNPGNVVSFTTTVAGVYSVIITDTVTGCFSTSASGTVTINLNPTVTVNSPSVCDGVAATVTATPGVAGSYDYVWTVPSGPNPGNVASFTTTIPGVYSVVITDTVTGCFSTSASGTVTSNPNPTVTVNSPTECEGTPATVTATPGVAGTYDYAWSVPSGPNPGNVASFTTTVAGVYSVIITDTVTGCFSTSASGTVTINPNPTVTVNSPSVCVGTSATVTATPGVAGSYDYAWSVPSGPNPGNVASFTTTVAGVYSVIITDTVTGCFSTSASGTVTINPNPTVTVNSPSVCDGVAATVTATPGVAGSYDYVWTVPSGPNPGNVASFTTTTPGVYSVVITDTVTGCFSTSASGTVTINTNPTVTVN